MISDLGVLRPHPQTEELQLTALYPGVTPDAARAATGWPLAVAESLETLPPPSPAELATLRDLEARTQRAHARAVRIALPRTTVDA